MAGDGCGLVRVSTDDAAQCWRSSRLSGVPHVPDLESCLDKKVRDVVKRPLLAFVSTFVSQHVGRCAQPQQSIST